ncbi:MAG: DUF493 domain-containing protein [Halomonadaceae bacterium]|nr:MAG: DUF493 domain-containing protein [Halomonadaceae bacterium]
MTEQTPPLIEFPCDYPVKIIGDAEPDFESQVLQLVQQHVADFRPESLRRQPSRNGRFMSLRLVLPLTSEAQLQALFLDLKASDHVRMVL